jgi:Tol biopolymer transport system component
MCDDHGIVQVWTISPLGGNPEQLTHNPTSIASAFTWSPDGRYITYITDGSVFITNAKTSQSRRNTGRTPPNQPLLPHACVFSPDGKKVAYLRRVDEKNQIFVASVENC